jgi:bifunctional N-acetylglucosamine-1-phosphate-uridyltransferase/glucosamine-1-phosphate-acetyltransferase GlmU-like protein
MELRDMVCLLRGVSESSRYEQIVIVEKKVCLESERRLTNRGSGVCAFKRTIIEEFLQRNKREVEKNSVLYLKNYHYFEREPICNHLVLHNM